MNLAQQIYLKAGEAAEAVAGLNLTPHDKVKKELELFAAQGIDPLDFSHWRLHFAEKLRGLQVAARNEMERLQGMANMKLPSELKKGSAGVPPFGGPPSGGPIVPEIPPKGGTPNPTSTP